MTNTKKFNVRKRTLNGILTAWVLLQKYPDATIHLLEQWEPAILETNPEMLNERCLIDGVKHMGFVHIWQENIGSYDELPILLKHINDAASVRKNIEFTEAILEYVVHPNQINIVSGNVFANVKTLNVLLRTWHYREHISIQIGSVLFGEKCRQIDEAVSLSYPKMVTYNNVQLPCKVAIASNRYAGLVSPRIVDVSTDIKRSGICISPYIDGAFILTVTMASLGLSFIFLQFLKTIATPLDAEATTFLIQRNNIHHFL